MHQGINKKEIEMAFNLIRNARVFFTTNVNSYGVINDGGTTPFSSANTQEIQVLDGFSFSQNTTAETVTLNEAGDAPNRGQRNFNTALEPVDFSFSTYIRPRDGNTGTSGIIIADAEEKVLWNAMFGTAAIGNAGAAWTAGTAGTSGTYATSGTAGSAGQYFTTATAPVVALGNSAKNQLQPFGIIICFDDNTFFIDNCVMDTGTMDFGLDTIANVQWAGKGGSIRTFAKTAITDNSTAGTSGVAASGTSGGAASIFVGATKLKDTSAAYLANKLSTLTLFSGINGTGGTSGTAGKYSIALTGGSLTFANNVSYLTPANLGVVNTPITYFTGTRAVSGSINAYLRTGTGSATALLNDLLVASKTDVNPAFNLTISVGGAPTATTRIDLLMPACVLTIPSIATEQVISTTINFTAQGSSGGAFGIENNNEIQIKYFCADT